MKIALTADLHLTSREKHPERFHALENILDQLVEQEIEMLIIAGDLFDATCTTPGELEEVFRKPEYSRVHVLIIPGNHDPVLALGAFSLRNIHYLTRPQQMSFENSVQFVLIPYANGTSVAEILATNQFTIEPHAWVLVSHGDWLGGTSQGNSYEGGTYMPVSGRDLQLYRPRKVFLGHIHVPLDTSVVHYTGSPCAIDPTETGYRSFLIFDTSTWQVSRHIVETDQLFIQERITILPVDDEEKYVRDLLSVRRNAWTIDPVHYSKVRVRVGAQGYSQNRQALVDVIRDVFKDFQFADRDQPDISQVKVSGDATQGRITEGVKRKLEAMNLGHNPAEADRDEILLAAMNYIYGGR